MEIRSFGDLSTGVLEGFADETYDEAKRLVERHGSRFPEERWHIDYWLMILSALVGEGKKANIILQQAVDSGLWWPERYLDQEELNPHLDQSLVATCYQRRDAALARSKPTLTTHRPVSEEDKPPLLFVFHRNHSNVSRDGENWRPALELGWGLALPQSSQMVGPDTHVWDDRDKALAEIELLTQDLRRKSSFDLERVITGGYVTGGNLAIRTALNATLGTAGFIALSPFIPDLEATFLPLLRQRDPASLRGVITIGERDSRCYPGALELAEHLQAAGAAVDVRVYPDFSQGYPPDFEAFLPEALRFIEG
jgi:hypothetical protein